MKAILNVIGLAAAATVLAACSTRVTHEVVREQPIVQPQSTVVERVAIVQPPPPPQETVPPAPAPSGYSWVPGHYVWRNGGWQWESGQWRTGTIRAMPPMRDGRVAALALPGATPLQGGIPIIIAGKVIGAIGVSGNTPKEDEDIAKVGAESAAAAIAELNRK